MRRTNRHDKGIIALAIGVLVVVIVLNIHKRMLYADLSKAVFEGNLPETERLLKKGASPIPTRGLLYVSLVNHHADIAKRLIDAGAEVDGRLLGLAVKLDEKEIALLLLQKGVDVKTGYRRFGVEEPLLHAAIGNDNREMVAELIRHKAPIDKAVEATGATPLHLAIKRGNPEIAALLLEAGANPNTTDAFKNTPLISAVKDDSLPLVQLLVKYHADIDVKGVKGYTPLLVACAQGNEEIVDYFLNLKANLNTKTDEQDGALDLAASFPNIVQALKKSGAQAVTP